jgi:protein XagA
MSGAEKPSTGDMTVKRLKALPAILALIAAVATGLVWTEQAEAGAWTQKQGTGFFKLNSQMLRGDKLREVNGLKSAIPTLADYTASLYAEYGLSDDLTLVGYLPFFKRITLNEQVGRPSGFVYFAGDEVSGIADAQAGVRYRLLQYGPTVFSAELVLGLPLGDDSQANGLLSGDGEINQRLTLQLGHSLYPVPAYFNIDLGFNNRLKGYSDEVVYSLETGYTIANRAMVILRLSGIESLENGDDSVSGGMGGLYANDQSFLSLGPELVYNVGARSGISLSAVHTLRVRNGLEAPVFSLGVFTKR